MKRSVTIALSIMVGTISSMASAETVTLTGTAGPSVTISTADLNINSREGIAVLRHRIRAAAASLCQTNAVEPINVRMARFKCYRSAVSSGHGQIDRIVAVQSAKPTRTVAMTDGTGFRQQ